MKPLFSTLTAANYDLDFSLLAQKAFAATDPTNSALMDLGVMYCDDEGPLARAGTLIHESTHLNMIASSNSIYPDTYGTTAARNLAITNPSAAIENADSWEFFSAQTK